MNFDMRINAILFFLTFICLNCKSQTVGLSMTNLKAPPQYFPIKKEKMNIFKDVNVQSQRVTQSVPRAIPLVFSVETLPFFCKIEYKMGLNKKLPVKFRLGDVQYVDEMEGKH
jgi:hypothetical protein